MKQILSARYKALNINLDRSIYGTFAEIGGGQETSSFFFKAGGASGTVAKTISAYDKAFSDTNYSRSGKYVSELRLEKMLEKEYGELQSLLGTERGNETCFFAFCNTVETINYQKDNQGHGWLGLRFQTKPGEEPCEIVVHVLLHEREPVQQQYTLGLLGVNLIYHAFRTATDEDAFLEGLTENIVPGAIEVNMIRMRGPAFSETDNRILSVKLVKNGLTPLAIFDRNGNTCQPGDMLYRKNVMILRGSFRPITYAGFDMLKTSHSLMKKELLCDKNNAVTFCEITLDNMLQQGSFDEQDFLDRVDLLNGMGQNVMISNFREFYRLTAYLSYIKIQQIRLVVGADVLAKVLDPSFYEQLKGGLLEAMGRLFQKHVRMYVYPSLINENQLTTAGNLNVHKGYENLYRHLLDNGFISDLTAYKAAYLPFSSHKVLDMIRKKRRGWENMVPVYIAEQIKKKGLFGYRE
jgi:hypothetical protein